MTKRNHLPGVDAAGGSTGRAGKRAEVVVERAILFDDEDDVLDLVQAMKFTPVIIVLLTCPPAGRGARDPATCCS
ncbi:MAG TPA: hypothetical protein VKE24_08160 [Candidatus Acidoferrales bacterium]|nr:hypothetical protein [Candidatus Acidoferrales bacterium]